MSASATCIKSAAVVNFKTQKTNSPWVPLRFSHGFLKLDFFQTFCHHLLTLQVICFLDTKDEIVKNVGNQIINSSHWLPQYEKNIMEVNGYCQLCGHQHSSKYFLLCSDEERNSNMFGTSGGWVNDRRIFGWTIPFTFMSKIRSMVNITSRYLDVLLYNGNCTHSKHSHLVIYYEHTFLIISITA